MSLCKTFKVDSPNVTYTEDAITAQYAYSRTEVRPSKDGSGSVQVVPVSEQYTITTDRKVPRTGVMFVGWGGNNGSTTTAMVLANKEKLSWLTKRGTQEANYFGSVLQAGTVRLGERPDGSNAFVKLGDFLPLVDPNSLVFDGWDISSMNLGDAMLRSRVLEPTLIEKIMPAMSKMVPRKTIYNPDFIAANQKARADNVLDGSPSEQVEQIRADIRDFKAKNSLDKVIVLWTANTERFAEIQEGLNDTAANLMASIERGESEVSPSTLFAVACILERVTYINGSPQNTFVPGCVELAKQHQSFIAGDDFKSGQTKLKSVLVDYLVSAGIKPVSIASYNHLGNNDGKNLSAPQTFRSKEISKSNVVDDMIASNGILYAPGEHPDHTVVIKYMPYVGDSKRAIDEYISEIAMGGQNTLAIHNTCEDSLLAAPLILDLVLLGEICERIKFKKEGDNESKDFDSVLSLLSYLTKAPLVPQGAPVVNALSAQRAAIENIFRACVGLPPESHMGLEHRLCTGNESAKPRSGVSQTQGGYATQCA